MRGRLGVGSAVIVGALTLAACSSGSSSSGVSESQLEAKIKKEPSISALLKQGGQKSKVASELVHCVATTLVKDANAADLQKYVAGKETIEDVGQKTGKSNADTEKDVQACTKRVVRIAG